MHSEVVQAGSLTHPRSCRAFTMLELLIVVVIIVAVAAFMVPALGPSTARTLDGATRQFAADLENARLIAIAERTRTRVLLPTSDSEFNALTGSTWPTDIARRGYVITSEKKTETVWRLRGKWNRFPQGIAVESFAQPTPTPTVTAVPITAGSAGAAANYTFNGPYIEFLANGSCSLDPAASPYPAVLVSGGLVNSVGTFTQTDRNLKYKVTIDPLSGSVTIK